MRTIYKEEVSRKKLHSIIAFFLVLVPLIYVSDVFDKMTLWNRHAGVFTNPTILGYAIDRCRTRYRYSLIADQLIIHKIKNGDQQIVENINIKDIESINKKLDIYSKLQIGRKYNCSVLQSWTCCCTYKKAERRKKIYFQPSDTFINKLNCTIISEKKKAS
jgi:hypothetical protein